MPRRELPAGAWNAFLHAESPAIERALEEMLPAATESPRRLHRAMRYSVFPGGKRIRPALAVLGFYSAGGRTAGGRTAGGRTAGGRSLRGGLAHRLGGAIELIHTFSLIHDDLPCMDDDDFRRGRLSCHRKFGEAIAVLAGDALQVLAFEALAGLPLVVDRRLAVLREISHAVGTRGVIGGQVEDLESEGRRISEAKLAQMHARKTGALLRASLVSGALAAGAPRDRVESLSTFGTEFGLLFQIVDDILNEVGSYSALGRRRGGDRQNGKATYLSVLGPDRTRTRLRRQVLASRAAAPSGAATGGRTRAVFLDLIDTVVGRLPSDWSEPGLAPSGGSA